MGPVRRIVKRAVSDAKTQALLAQQRLPIRANTVMYEAYSGAGVLCNPEAIFRALLRTDGFEHWRHIWAIEDQSEIVRLKAAVGNSGHVRFVRVGSVDYYREIARSQYVINNSTFPPIFTKRDGQTYLNTWHGTPLKTMGYDVPGGAPDTRNIIRNFLNADYLLSANPFMTETMYRHAYRLDGVFRGTVIEEGTARTDLNFMSRKQAREELAKAGLTVGDNERTLLVAPTWKGASFYEPVDNSDELADLAHQLQVALGGAGWRVLLKVHQRQYAEAARNSRLRGALVPNHLPTNLVLAATDALVTDYSSIFYDFLPSERPIVFFEPDIDDYNDYRGMYRDVASLPGPVAHSIESLISVLARLGTGEPGDPDREYADRRALDRQTYCPYDDGHVADRIVDAVFGGNLAKYRHHADLHRTGKQRILIGLGGLLPNGITTSALNLLRHFDYDRFDVSVSYAYSGSQAKLRNALAIDERARHLPKLGAYLPGYTRFTLNSRRAYGPGVDPNSSSARKTFAREYRRTFGSATFDYVVDFSGYSPVWAGMLAAAPGQHHAIWQHNDLAAECAKTINGAQPHRRTLPNVFRLYRQFDSIVSVSQDLVRTNSERLSQYAPAAKYHAVPNIIDGERVLSLAKAEIGEIEPHDVPTHDDEAAESRLRDFGETIHRLERWVSDGDFLFTWIGRMSPEKDPIRLVTALAHLKATASPQAATARLAMIGGGALQPEVESAVHRLRISDSVAMLGQIDNPFAVLARSDCFVLASNHEGQPMVILEARVLGLPVVTTRFGTAESAVPPDAGIIVERSPAAVADGMAKAMRGEVPHEPFDFQQYNVAAMASFFEAIMGAWPSRTRSPERPTRK